MKLYYAPGACSLADHIALHEIGAPFEIERVDIRTKMTERGTDFRTISAKGYVPVLVLPDGTVLTENIAVLDWIADSDAGLRRQGLERTRQLEALAFISTELHRAFKPMWHGGDAKKAAATLTGLFGMLDVQGTFLFGEDPSVADFYLFVMLLWAERFGVEVLPAMQTLRDAMRDRPAVQGAMQAEGLI